MSSDIIRTRVTLSLGIALSYKFRLKCWEVVRKKSKYFFQSRASEESGWEVVRESCEIISNKRGKNLESSN